METDRPSRAQRRRDSEERVLASARRLFAEVGYDQAGIRAIAVDAGVDPALVMQLYGSKDNLFARAAVLDWSLDDVLDGTGEPAGGADASPLERFVDAFIHRMEHTGEAAAVKAMLRSSLTHPAAGAALRTVLLEDATAAFASALGARSIEAAQFAASMLIGVTISRYILAVEPLASMETDVLRRHLHAALSEALK